MASRSGRQTAPNAPLTPIRARDTLPKWNRFHSTKWNRSHSKLERTTPPTRRAGILTGSTLHQCGRRGMTDTYGVAVFGCGGVSGGHFAAYATNSHTDLIAA